MQKPSTALGSFHFEQTNKNCKDIAEAKQQREESKFFIQEFELPGSYFCGNNRAWILFDPSYGPSSVVVSVFSEGAELVIQSCLLRLCSFKFTGMGGPGCL